MADPAPRCASAASRSGSGPAAALSACLGLALACAAPSAGQSADTLPAFKTDSAAADPFRRLEAGASPAGSVPAQRAGTADSGLRPDTVTARLTRRRPAVSLWFGAEFSDLDAKETFKADLAARQARDSLELLQPYDEAPVSFPVGLQALVPLGAWFDAAFKVRFSRSKEGAILGRKDKSAAGESWYGAQTTVGGAGLRYYVPPSLMSVNGSLGLFAQFLWLWELGGSELYTRNGSARAAADPSGTGYELHFGLQQAVNGPWKIAGSLGFVRQASRSDRDWSDLLLNAPPAGRVRWSSSSIQVNIALWYHFGALAGIAAPKPAESAPTAAPPPRSAP